MKQIAKRLYNGALNASLWLVGFGLMLASSGIDGAYMAKLMPEPWLGYVLNTVSDIGAEILMFWYGRLRLNPKNTKRHKNAVWLLPAEFILTGFAWLFGWRQLLPIVTVLEDAQTARWLAPVLAAFTPFSLAAVGYTQALLAGRIEAAQDASQESQAGAEAAQPAAQNGNGAVHACPYCGATTNARGEPLANANAVSAHLRFCDAYRAQRAAQERKVAQEMTDND